MTQSSRQLPALTEIDLDPQRLLYLQREQLLPLRDAPIQLNYYADAVVQAQSAQLIVIDAELTQQLSQTIAQLLKHLQQATTQLKTRRFNALQRWLGLDIESDVTKIKYLDRLDAYVDQANHLSQKLKLQLAQSSQRRQHYVQLRREMAHAIVAAQQFLQQYPLFQANDNNFDSFEQRLSKKIETLQRLQHNHDLAYAQMQLNEQLALQLLDRFKEAQQVLLPAWQQQLRQNQDRANIRDIQQLQGDRDKLINSLIHTLKQ
ncbi:hypothetical protein [Acinetobacter larvae]|uniref:Tellurium resistance protein n=1 Tax=Acinetobacter larvae TaxID=1789224 RepID=A0A1B2LYK2_9GAMM|nr:hypothetical protein [Acinetobacter larvae]AOA57853.1 hypothetical protein BFG52_05450 [Acinetobacter larvae]